MKKKSSRTPVKKMNAVRKKAPYRDAVRAIEQKLDEIKKIGSSARPAQWQPSLFGPAKGY